MSIKKNLPNIPIYIGDWERDCNIISVEAEGAWLRIIFKMWNKGRQSTIKMPTKSLQNLWRCSQAKMNEIVDELILNEICEVSQNESFIEFTCRRFVKENKISEARSKAGKSSKKQIKTETKPKQKANKSEQNTEDVNENENESVIENKSKNEKYKNSDFSKILIQLGADKIHVQDWIKARKNKKAVNSETALRRFVNECKNNNYPVAEAVKCCAENSWSGFKYEWVENLQNNKQNGNRTQNHTPSDAELKRQASDAYDKFVSGK